MQTRSCYVTIGLAFAVTVAGCSSKDTSVVNTGVIGGEGSTGGSNNGGSTVNLGGTNHGGGATGTGSTTSANSGGNIGTGGATNKGGAAGVAGGAGTGGIAGLGGNTSASSGGASVGGTSTKATGGSSGPGGSVGTGGKTNTGGSTTNAAGGTATGGQNNATGGQGTGGLSRGPTTDPTGKSHFPFPQNRQSPNCIYPTAYSNDDVQAVYTAWKSALVSNQGVGSNCTNCERVIRPAEPGTLQVNSTVSEGIGYGMIIAVYMNDQTLFDSLWRYALAHTWTSSTGSTLLMNWYIAADGNVASTTDGGQSGNGAATDADEDMAWSLIMADRQWGGQGSLSKTYLAYAQQMLSNIWTYDIDQTNLIPNNGNWGGINCLNISYFAPAYYRVFASVGNQSGWNTVVTNLYGVISQSLNATNGNQTNGLVPGFSTNNGATANCGQYSTQEPHTYQYDACRTPFRIGLDACTNDSTDAIGYVAKTSSFFSSQGGASKIVDGYQLDGTQNAQYPGTYNGLSAAFIGPAGVGAMPTQSGQNYQSFIDDVYSLVRQNNMWCGGQYYDESWTMMTMLMMTGNFLDYTKY